MDDPGVQGACMRLLVVEDNTKLGQFLGKAFREEGYTVDLATDGKAALEQIASSAFDAVILDWMLPECDGIAVCQAVRERGNRIPILVLSARGDVSDRVFALDAGADDYLPKPFELSELLARTRALLRRGGSNPGNVLRVGPVAIDRNERRVTVDGKRIDLTPREFALLSHLASEVGKVVSRMDLLSRVWDLNFDPGSNVVEVHIKNLRDKLGSRSSLIETVRGLGYRFAVPSADEGPPRD